MMTTALITELQDCFTERAKLQNAAMSIQSFANDASIFYSYTDGWGKKKYINIPIEPTSILPILGKYIKNINKEIIRISNHVEVIIQNIAELSHYIEDYKKRYPETYTSEQEIYTQLENSVKSRLFAKEPGNCPDVCTDYHISVCSDWEDKVYVFSVIGNNLKHNEITFIFKEIFKL